MSMSRNSFRYFLYLGLIGCFLFILVFSLSKISAQTGDLKIVILNVGQGDALFIQTPSKFQILIDGGPGAGVLSELGRVMAPWDRSIDMLVATHPDQDHIGGLPDVVHAYRISRHVDSGFSDEKSLAQEYRKLLNEKEIEQFIVRSPERISLEDGVTLSFLNHWEEKDMDSNDSSLILRIDYGEASFLFTGDASSDIESRLINTEYEHLDVDVLKLGHHGSKTSTSELFLEATTPHMAIISAGKNNKYGHPSKEVVDRIRSYRIPSVCTCDVGRITFTSDGKRIFMRR